jgi:uncharacterized repeat protein (TIGR01451 family)
MYLKVRSFLTAYRFYAVAVVFGLCAVASVWLAAAIDAQRSRSVDEGDVLTRSTAMTGISQRRLERMIADDAEAGFVKNNTVRAEGDCPFVLTHSSSQTITPSNSVHCGSGGIHADNSYWRAFNLNDFGVSPTDPYQVTSVSFGIERANAPSGSQPVTVRLHANNGTAFPAGTLTLLASTTVNVSNQTGTILTVPIAATVPAGTLELVMEVFTPSGSGPGNSFFIGSNTAAETAPSYVSASACSIPAPVTFASVGFPNVRVVMNVNGFCGPLPTPTPTPTPSPSPTPSCSNTIIYAYNFANDHLISFRPNNPGVLLTNIPLIGLNTAEDEFLRNIDFRPADGQLYGVATKGIPGQTSGDRLVRIDPVTGVITQVNAANFFVTPSGLFFGDDFNPIPDRLREFGDSDINRRINPNDGTLAGIDTTLAYATGDPNQSQNPNVVHAAYDRNFVGTPATTLYGIDSNTDALVTVGGINGTPSPNGGQVFTVGPLGTNVTSFGGFDIQRGTNNAYAVLRQASVSRFYRINLTTGAATLIGTVGAGDEVIDGVAIAWDQNACADLSITKTDGRTTINPGESTTYTITVTNNGPDPVINANVVDNFPPALTGVSWTCTPSGGATCPPSGSGNINVLVNLPVGGSVVFTATATVTMSTTFGYANTATVSVPAGVVDNNPVNNSATDLNTVCSGSVFSYTGPPVDIPDGNGTGVNIPINVSGVGTISDLNFRIDGTPSGTVNDPNVGISHTWVGDLRVRITSPLGTPVTVIDRIGVPASTFGCNNNNLANILLDSEASAPPIENQCNPGDNDPFPSGTFTPNNSLAAFNGENANGVWTINVSDLAVGDVGAVRRFSLVFGGCPLTAAGVEVSGRVLTSDGRGLRNAVVSMTDPNGVVRTAVTSSFGYYRFDNVEPGTSYVMGVNSRNYRFTPRIVYVTDTLTDVDFIGAE